MGRYSDDMKKHSDIEKYSIVFDHLRNLYAKDTKVIVERAVITKDNDTGKVFAQIKMKNISPKTLIAVKVVLNGFDVSREKIEENEYTYLDIMVERGELFGQKTPVKFQNNTVRSFDVKITETVYADGSKLTYSGTENYQFSAPEQLSKQLSNSEIRQYRIDNVQDAKYIIYEFSDIWVCTCGKVNINDCDSCYSCGASRENLKRTFNKELLNEEINSKIYNDAVGRYRPGDKYSIERAVLALGNIEDYKDSRELIKRFKSEINELCKREEADAKAEQKEEAVKKVVCVFAVFAMLLLICALLSDYVITPRKLGEAEKLIDEGKYEEAYAILGELNSYDSREMVAQINIETLKECDAGSIVRLGNYHGTVKWIVLEKQDGKVLLISKCCIDAKPYNEEYAPVTWETCTLRQWLNDDFFNEAFSEKEKELICDTHLQNPDNPEYGTDGGNDTTDKVFLLSIDEASRYFADNEARLTYATAYAKENGAGDKNAWWGLRSPGEDENNVAMVGDVGSISSYSDGKSVYVNKDGAVNCDGQNVGSNFGIRPAIWANIE